MAPYNPDEDFAELVDTFVEVDGMDERLAVGIARTCVGITLAKRRAAQCPHCDEQHAPGHCQFKRGGIVYDHMQLAGD